MIFGYIKTIVENRFLKSFGTVGQKTDFEKFEKTLISDPVFKRSFEIYDQLSQSACINENEALNLISNLTKEIHKFLNPASCFELILQESTLEIINKWRKTVVIENRYKVIDNLIFGDTYRPENQKFAEKKVVENLTTLSKNRNVIEELSKDEIHSLFLNLAVRKMGNMKSQGLLKKKSKKNKVGSKYSAVNEIQIGDDIWMIKNLDVSHFRNGDPIPQIIDKYEWLLAGQNGNPAFCYYENKNSKNKLYGKLYNWHALNDSRGLVPHGWQNPNIEQWTKLIKHFEAIYKIDFDTRKNPIDAESYLKRGQDRLAARDYKGAIADYIKVLESDPYLAFGGKSLNFELSADTSLIASGERYEGSFFGGGENGKWWSSDECSTEIYNSSPDPIGKYIYENGFIYKKFDGYFDNAIKTVSLSFEKRPYNFEIKDYSKASGLSLICIKSKIE
jgi:uncharacterized protein (TIGR02145 family)